MDRQFDSRRPQSTTWTTVTPQTPTFNPTKFTPVVEQNTWKPSFPTPAKNENKESNVILGNVKQDPSGGFVHTFGAPKKPATPQTASSHSSENSPWQNYNNSPSRQQSVNSVSSPRYVQEIPVPSAPVNQQSKSPVRQTSFQNNASQFSPVQQSPQRSSPGVYFNPQNNAYDNRINGTPVYQVVRQTAVPQQTRQDSTPYNTARQDSTPYNTARQDSTPYNTARQDSTPYSTARQDSSPYNTARQDSVPFQRQNSSTHPNSWNGPSSPYETSRQDSWSNHPSQQNSYPPLRQDSWSNTSVNQSSPSYPPSTPDTWSSSSYRPQSVPYEPPSPSVASPGLFSKQHSVSPSSPDTAIRYDPIPQNSTPGLRRQSSVQYQPSPKPYSQSSYSPNEPQYSVPQSANSPYSYGVPGPFARQQSTGGPQPWSPGSAESFPPPPPFSPSSETTGAPWASPSDLPSPPPPPPLPTQSVPQAPPVLAPPPPPPPPPPPMPSSAGINQEVPAWKKQIQATKEAKAAAGYIPQTPGTPSQELPAAIVNSMKKDKKPFTYLPGGIDLSEIRSPKMQRRIMANQQHAPPPPSVMGHQVQLQPKQNGTGPQPIQNQMERLNLSDGPQCDRMAAVDAQRRSSTDGNSSYPGQSRSFRILQMMTGGDDETDAAPRQPSPAKRDEEEMRFTGIRRPDNPIPSRAFHALQKMTQGEEGNTNPQEARYANDGPDEVRQDDVPQDIRYKGGYIPGRSFKMLQEMTGANEDGSGGNIVPSVLQAKRKPNLHLNINQNEPQPQVPKQFPQPSVPASQQTTEEPPKMYRGGRIPSQSFRMLQAMTGESQDSQGEDGTDM